MKRNGRNMSDKLTMPHLYSSKNARLIQDWPYSDLNLYRDINNTSYHEAKVNIQNSHCVLTSRLQMQPS